MEPVTTTALPHPPARVLVDLGPIAQLRAGRLGRRLPQLYVGLVLYGVSMALMVRGDLGAGALGRAALRPDPAPADHARPGARDRSSFVVLLLWIPLREMPGIGTISNALVIGVAADAAPRLLDRPDALVAARAS